MFTSITLNSFRAFENLTFDLSSRNNNAKNIAIVYGENGAGKSNLMSAFVLLNELLNTMNVRDMIEEVLNQKAVFSDENMERALKTQLVAGLRDIQAIIDDYRMVGSTEPIIAEYEFIINGYTGKYIIELGEHEIIHERLEYLISRRRGVYFDYSKSDAVINSNIVKDRDLLSDIKAATKRFWGKHSILAIILHEIRDKSSSFGWDNISDNFSDVLGELLTLSCFLGIGNRRWDKLSTPIGVLQNVTSGSISNTDERQLDVLETVLTRFFTAVNSDIKTTYYKRTYNDKRIEYELYFEKLISGEFRSIPFSKESTGYHQLLKTLCYIISACFGSTVVIDEVDSGIHDVLFQKVIAEIAPKIDGQLIMTTHNTLLMECEIARESTYILREVNGGHKEIRCVNEYEKRLYLNNNIRNKYLNNEYGGLPEVKPINFDELLHELTSAIEP